MYEYKAVPAPERTPRVRGLKTTGERFAHMLTETLNGLAGEGWEFLRAETLPCVERKGLMGSAASTQVVLIFRRELPRFVPPAEGPFDPVPAVAHGLGYDDEDAAQDSDALDAPHPAAPVVPLAPAAERQPDIRGDHQAGLRAERKAARQAERRTDRATDTEAERTPLPPFTPQISTGEGRPGRAAPPAPKVRRSEPVFRPGALIRPEGARTLPPLRSARTDDDGDGGR